MRQWLRRRGLFQSPSLGRFDNRFHEHISQVMAQRRPAHGRPQIDDGIFRVTLVERLIGERVSEADAENAIEARS